MPLPRDPKLVPSGVPCRQVLLVGDPGLARGLLRTLLTRLDYVVTSVPTGAEGLAAILKTRFAVALVALWLPDMPGMAVVRRLAARRPGNPHVPTLVFGESWDRASLLRECREAGVEGHFESPISFTRLVAAVRELTQGQQRPDESEPMPASPIELDRLHSFTEGDPALQRELCDLYLETAERYLDRMAAALREQQAWSDPAHGLKGASANFGAHLVARLAAGAERETPSAEALGALTCSLAQVRRFIHRELLTWPAGGPSVPHVGSPQQSIADPQVDGDRA